VTCSKLLLQQAPRFDDAVAAQRKAGVRRRGEREKETASPGRSDAGRRQSGRWKLEVASVGRRNDGLVRPVFDPGGKNMGSSSSAAHLGQAAASGGREACAGGDGGLAQRGSAVEGWRRGGAECGPAATA
jgi:hypothetical protein